jgi:hypothetical protein
MMSLLTSAAVLFIARKFCRRKIGFGADGLAGTADDQIETVIGATDIDLFVGDENANKGIRVTGAELALLITEDKKYALEASGQVEIVNIPGVVLSGRAGGSATLTQAGTRGHGRREEQAVERGGGHGRSDTFSRIGGKMS